MEFNGFFFFFLFHFIGIEIEINCFIFILLTNFTVTMIVSFLYSIYFLNSSTFVSQILPTKNILWLSLCLLSFRGMY